MDLEAGSSALIYVLSWHLLGEIHAKPQKTQSP
jgi:hypothetical protein